MVTALVTKIIIIVVIKAREHKKSFKGDGYVYYLDVIMGVCLCPSSSSAFFSLSICQ